MFNDQLIASVQQAYQHAVQQHSGGAVAGGDAEAGMPLIASGASAQVGKDEGDCEVYKSRDSC